MSKKKVKVNLWAAFALWRWFILAAVIGVMAGSASAALIAGLNWANDTREAHRWLIALLPVGGFLVGWLYLRSGDRVAAGNNLILREIHAPEARIPLRMTPLILLGTIITHIFGGSAGREGTAVQMGAGLADQVAYGLKMDQRRRRILLMTGVAGGFGSVFGTPLAGAVFGMEFLAVGTVEYDAIFPCFVAAFIGEWVTHAWGVAHTIYRVTDPADVSPLHVLIAVVAGIAFGLISRGFAVTTHYIGKWFAGRFAYAPLRPLFGGALVALIIWGTHAWRFAGLGIPVIVESFTMREPGWVWAAKLGLTALTLGAGFKGGEVTPLFFIGATAGSALSAILPMGTSALAAMGFVAVFAGAANTPIASSLMALELFGPEAGSLAAIACVVSYVFSGNMGIYGSQLAGRGKDALWREAKEMMAEKKKL